MADDFIEFASACRIGVVNTLPGVATAKSVRGSSDSIIVGGEVRLIVQISEGKT
jgi:hypothetical protein